MHKKIAATAVAATLLAGGAAGAALLGPSLASAADSSSSSTATPVPPAAPDPTKWIASTLKPLVDAGTITQAQADAVAQALAKAGPPPGLEGPGRGARGPGLAAAATAIGIDDAALRTALQSGKTIAGVATDHGVDVQKVIDAMVAEMRSRLASDVSSGRLTQAQADQLAADASQHVSDLVNGKAPRPPAAGLPGLPPPGSSTPA